MDACTLAILAAVAAPLAPKGIEIEAKTWFNPLSFRVPDDRDYVIFFFSTFEDRQAVEPLVKELNRLPRMGGVVVGLSPAPSDRVRKFIDRHGVRFAVGARTKTHRGFGIDRFPTIVRFKAPPLGSDVSWDVLPLVDLVDFRARADAQKDLASGGFDEFSPLAELQNYAREDPNPEKRERALDLLRQRMGARDFMQFCDDLLSTTESTTDRGEIAYQRHLADPDTQVKQPRYPPSSLAEKELRNNPSDPRWDPVHQYNERLGKLTADELFGD